MTQYCVKLQFEAGGPAVTGWWSNEATARRNYRDHIGLYGSGQSVVIRLVEETAGGQRVLETWPAAHGGESES
ncbi:hypothetical protein [Streptomyces capuensis]|uniref:hypothetical protein n=1 Tax=Streptomyces capuensis TaxID=1464056 RepID=UPI0004C2325C|nr:hypothetical protein [Streptomyces capuensis]